MISLSNQDLLAKFTGKVSMPKIVIIGAGFGGVALAKKLKGLPAEILLIDKHNYHTFQPLLYQVGLGSLEPDSIAYPVRRIFRGQKNISFRMAEVKYIHTEDKCLDTSAGKINYDYLIIACGGSNNYFNFNTVKSKLLPLKSVPDALNLRSFLMQNLERASAITEEEEQLRTMTIAIVGGGPTGVELAGSLAEIKKYVLPKDFPELDLQKMRIFLFELAPRLLPAMSEQASTPTLKYLKNLGVDVRLKTMVKNYNGNHLLLDDGSEISTLSVIWTAGVKGAPVKGLPDEVIDKSNRILVNRFNQVKGFNELFALGDVAAMSSDDSPRGHPMLAPVAIQQGRHLAENIKRLLKDQPLKPFVYKDKGTMVTIGRTKAVVDLPKWKFKGAFAWFVWLSVHIMSLVGFRNKLVTLIDWFVNYVNYDRPLGLIIRPFRKIRGLKSTDKQKTT